MAANSSSESDSPPNYDSIFPDCDLVEPVIEPEIELPDYISFLQQRSNYAPMNNISSELASEPEPEPEPELESESGRVGCCKSTKVKCCGPREVKCCGPIS